MYRNDIENIRRDFVLFVFEGMSSTRLFISTPKLTVSTASSSSEVEMCQVPWPVDHQIILLLHTYHKVEHDTVCGN
jgi:hypothetical protein